MPTTERGRPLLILTACLFVTTLLALIGCDSSSESPNIILILVDTLRADYLGSYGFEGDISPAIDRMAAESIIFTRSISQAPWTKPSIASLFTSLSPETHRVVDVDGRYWRDVGGIQKTSALPEDAVTLAEALNENGYQTAGWSGNGWIIDELGFSQGFEVYNAPPEGGKNIFDAANLLKPAWKWLQNRDDERPFFMYLHFMDTHGPWRWSQEDWDLLNQSPSLGGDFTMTPDQKRRGKGFLRFMAGRDLTYNRRIWRATYSAGVRVFDRRLGLFLDNLRESGLLDNTLLVFTSDHGEELLDHGWWGHGHNLFVEGLRVPLMIRLPGGQSAGRRIDETVSLIDVMPTLLSAAGVDDPPPDMQGHDLWRVVQGDDPETIPGWAMAGGVKESSKRVSLQNNTHKMIWEFPDGPMVLFDLLRDPAETTDVSLQNKDVADRMASRIAQTLVDLKARGTLQQKESPLSEEEIERLRSLGYIN